MEIFLAFSLCEPVCGGGGLFEVDVAVVEITVGIIGAVITDDWCWCPDLRVVEQFFIVLLALVTVWGVHVIIVVLIE